MSTSSSGKTPRSRIIKNTISLALAAGAAAGFIDHDLATALELLVEFADELRRGRRPRRPRRGHDGGAGRGGGRRG